MPDESPPKEAAPDPEIPDELRSKLSRKKRPAGYAPKSPEAEDLNEKEEQEAPKPVRDLRAFFKKLRAVLKGGKFHRIVERTREVTRNGETFEETRQVKIEVKLMIGADGLPYVADAVGAAETRRIRETVYKDAPTMDKGLGDLTPAFVEWLYLNHPYDAAVRYFSRSTHVQAWAVAHAA